MFDAHSDELQVGVIGCGAMGRGIAQWLAQAGIMVCLFDAKAEAAQQAHRAIAHSFTTLAGKGKLSADQALAAMENISVRENLHELAPMALVIEAIVEDLAVKQALFLELEAIVGPHAVLASNTSSLSITSIASVCSAPQRVAGFHFFNPVPLMKVVEVVAGVRTDAAVLHSLGALAQRCGHRAVQAQDTPGFIVNHAGRGYGTESLKLLGEGVASAQEIDLIMREAAGFRLGPFELFDLVGLDVSVPVMEAIYRQYFEEPRYRPSALLVQRRNAGLLGRKSGQGFYRYQDGRAIVAGQENLNPVMKVTQNASAVPLVWVCREEAQFAAQLLELLATLGLSIDEGDKPAANSLCLVTPLGEDVSSVVARLNLPASRVFGVDMLCGVKQRRVLVSNPASEAALAATAQAMLSRDAVPVSLVGDSVGLVLQRILAHIVNIACDMAQQGIASPVDIDAAVKLGLGYPHGPLTWGEQLGVANIHTILQRMFALTGDARYRPASWLRRRAQLGLSLFHPEGGIAGTGM